MCVETDDDNYQTVLSHYYAEPSELVRAIILTLFFNALPRNLHVLKHIFLLNSICHRMYCDMSGSGVYYVNKLLHNAQGSDSWLVVRSLYLPTVSTLLTLECSYGSSNS